MVDQSEAARLAVSVNEQDHVQGPSTAPVTVVEYGDYECPHCGRAHQIVKRIQGQLGPQVRFVYRNFPLSQSHPHAEVAAEAAEAAAVQGKFWEMHDYLFEHQGWLDEEHLPEYARILSLDADELERDLEEGTHRERVQRDLASGAESDVEGTPTFFINGVKYTGSYDAETLLAAIQAQM